MDRSDIQLVNTRELYEGLRSLWVRVFGDEPGFVDAFYENFGADLSFGSGRSGNIDGYVICNEEGDAISALTLYRCGRLYVPEGYPYWEDEEAEEPEEEEMEALPVDLAGMPVYVSYAICTDPEYRGRGSAAALTGYVKELVMTKYGGISLVSPAEPSLEDFYAALGYRYGFTVSEGTGFPEMLLYNEEFDEDDDDEGMMWGLDAAGTPGFIEDEDFEAFDPGLSVVSADASRYNTYREAFLADTVHVAFSDEMLDAVRMCSLNEDGLLVINGGDAIAVVNDMSGEGGRLPRLVAQELLVNPMLMDISAEIDAEIAARLAIHYGLERLNYRTPGYGISQSMYAAEEGQEITGYFGFPIE